MILKLLYLILPSKTQSNKKLKFYKQIKIPRKVFHQHVFYAGKNLADQNFWLKYCCADLTISISLFKFNYLIQDLIFVGMVTGNLRIWIVSINPFFNHMEQLALA